MNTSVHPYLNFNGNCEEAFNFYKSVFGGNFEFVGRFKDMPPESPVPENMKEKIMHISYKINDNTTIFGSDASEAFGGLCSFGNNITLSINAQSEEEAKRIFNSLSAEGKINMPLEKTFWGALFGMFTDKFNVNWMVNYDYEK